MWRCFLRFLKLFHGSFSNGEHCEELQFPKEVKDREHKCVSIVVVEDFMSKMPKFRHALENTKCYVLGIKK